MPTFVGAAEPLTTQGLHGVLDDLGVGVPELLALLAVESKSCGFLPSRQPVILFERHIFHKRTNGRFSRASPDISDPTPGGYAGMAKEFPRLAKAVRLDRTAALLSTSWGAGQVMGFNHAAAGFGDVEQMVEAMQASEDAQLASVAAFLRARSLVSLLRARDWPALARAYNGPAFAKNKYDLRLAGAFEQFKSGALPDVEVRRAQLYLTYLGYAPGAVDGLHGKLSRGAVVDYRQTKGLGGSDRVDKALLESLGRSVRAL